MTKLTPIIAALAMLVIASCCCCCAPWSDWEWEGTIESTVVYDWSTPVPSPTPVTTRESAGARGEETEVLLETTDIPVRDFHELAIRLRGLPADTPRTINPEGSPDYPIGTERTFHVSNVDTDEQFDITAVLQYKTEHVYMWIEEGVHVDQQDVIEAAETFESQAYATNRSFFGSEWSPGVDNDPHITILHAHNLGTSYYSSADEFVSAVRSDSNEMEMFYIDLDWWRINGLDYHATLAHEFQHMIHWYHDRNEDTWMNEGFSELASYLNGFEPHTDDAFASLPDNQLTDIDYDATDSAAGYGAGYLFTAYFLDRYGSEATQALVAHGENSMASVDAVLAELDPGKTHEAIFADWVIANLLDQPDHPDGYYGYRDIDPSSFAIEETVFEADYPLSDRATVHQYGTDYIELRGRQPLTLSFAGSPQVGLVNTQAHSGQYVWWSNRGDDSDMTLTRAFDLTEATDPTLSYWTWYNIEENWDYAYVEASSDDGETWQILTTPSGTASNPNGNSFGWGYTGQSGGWIQEEVDLSPYAGQQVLIRFEYVTDDALNRPGLVLDDIAIPEIGYFSDVETADGWDAQGWIRHANVLPQRWLIQLITYGPEIEVERLTLTDHLTGSWEIPLGRETDKAIVAISAIAPVTTELAQYEYQIESR